jgi:hypothetical protein
MTTEKTTVYIEDLEQPVTTDALEKAMDGTIMSAKTLDGTMELIRLIEQNNPGTIENIVSTLAPHFEEE